MEDKPTTEELQTRYNEGCNLRNRAAAALYEDAVVSLAASVFTDYYLANKDSGDDFELVDAVHETVDGCQFVIYTYWAEAICVGYECQTNEDPKVEYQLELGGDGTPCPMHGAYFALSTAVEDATAELIEAFEEEEA